MLFDIEIAGKSVAIIERESLKEAQVLCNDLYPDCDKILIMEIIFCDNGVWIL